ncbi:MAG: hypothetical protein JWL72_1655 [Ilumatobacteraceae bacterium]|nr:hypothetical protein [Ilumatobacteraceae bacterium]MCU1388317.1 hypothetical protein [Ilumatobacteraceae bacterium]
MSTRRLKMSRAFPATLEQAYDTVLTTPLTDLFDRHYGVIARIKGVTDQEGEWGRAVGQTRTIHLADRGTMRETLRVIDRPREFGYTITDVTGAMKALVAAADGTWTFEPAGTGVRVTWRWDLTPTKIGRLAMPVFSRLWLGYARQAMDRIEQILVP